MPGLILKLHHSYFVIFFEVIPVQVKVVSGFFLNEKELTTRLKVAKMMYVHV